MLSVLDVAPTTLVLTRFEPMTHILRIDSSSRIEGSHSRELADFFQQTWLAKHPSDSFVIRDVMEPAIPHVDAVAIAGFQTPADQRTEAMTQAVALSDQLIAELKQADVLLISTPMYNFSIPSALKAWVDQIVRQGQTFAMDDSGGFSGLLTTQKAFIVSAYGAGGYHDGGPFSALNFVTPYLQGLLGFLGITDIQCFAAEGMMAAPDDRATTLENIKKQMQQAIG